MEKALTLPIDMSARQSGDEAYLLLDFADDAIASWCLGLVLLQRNLVDRLSVSDRNASYTLIMRPTSGHQRATAHWKETEIALDISEAELDGIIGFFLTYFRDGIADVDHIDIQYESDDPETAYGYVTLKVPRTRMRRLSGDELRKYLDSL